MEVKFSLKTTSAIPSKSFVNGDQFEMICFYLYYWPGFGAMAKLSRRKKLNEWFLVQKWIDARSHTNTVLVLLYDLTYRKLSYIFCWSICSAFLFGCLLVCITNLGFNSSDKAAMLEVIKVRFPVESKAIFLINQHGRHDATCKPAIIDVPVLFGDSLGFLEFVVKL